MYPGNQGTHYKLNQIQNFYYIEAKEDGAIIAESKMVKKEIISLPENRLVGLRRR